ncbi:hypothetical protein AAG906_025155 [Vitis piasezkii]
MVEAAQDDCKANPKLFERLLEDAEKPLYPNCKNFTKLSALVKLYNLKGRYGWSDKSFSELLSLLGDMLPINNELPLSMYEMHLHVLHVELQDLIWHAQGGEFDGKIASSIQLAIMEEPRNLRLAISTDGINPHIVMITYNLPPWLCMKRKFMMLSLLISGPQQPGNDIDIYLAPWIKDLKTLWEIGVEAYDAYQRESKDILLVQYVDRKPIHIDGLNSRLDLMDMGLRKEKKVFCQTLAELKVPEGYCSNFRNLVSMEDLKLYGLKSHDYHTPMQQLLLVVLRSLLPKHVRHAIARLSLFFNALCKKVVDVSTLDKLQNELVVTLCLLEKYFLPSFFDIMIHLTVHLVREVRLCGSVYFRWIYPFERFIKVLKGYVRNRNHPEGCIVECYIARKLLNFV